MPYTPKWLLQQIIAPIMRPATRFLVGVIAIPLLRIVRTKVARTKEWDAEFEKDIEQWFRGSLILFFATKNVERAIVTFLVELEIDISLDIQEFDKRWWITAGRLLLAIGVIESMPDQELFAIVHPGPEKPKWIKGQGLWGNIRLQFWPTTRGVLCQHLNRSSPVFVILSVIYANSIGWWCYLIAITQYLIIGLVTSRDKARDVLSEFDKQVAKRRKAIVDEFQIEEDDPGPQI